MRGMLAEMTATEFAEWEAYADLEPFGFWEENRRAALVCQTVANASGNIRRPMKLIDFMPRPGGRRQSLVDKVKAIFGYGRS